MDLIYESNTLQHHGILGMKWGVRRYQNHDGSLTPAGKKRRARLESELKELGGTVKRTTSKKPTSVEKKTVESMTDKQLEKAINRARMEDQYRSLRPDPVTKGDKAKKYAADFIEKAVVPAVIKSGENFMNKALDKLGSKVLKDAVDPNSTEAIKKKVEKLRLMKEYNELTKGKPKEPSLEELVKKMETERKYQSLKSQLGLDKDGDETKSTVKPDSKNESKPKEDQKSKSSDSEPELVKAKIVKEKKKKKKKKSSRVDDIIDIVDIDDEVVSAGQEQVRRLLLEYGA